jgi:hypothetical protein
MPTDDRVRRRATFRRPLLILGFAMTLFYVGLGSWLLLDPTFLPGISAEFRNIFAVMLLIYGVYRGWRIYADLRA